MRKSKPDSAIRLLVAACKAALPIVSRHTEDEAGEGYAAYEKLVAALRDCEGQESRALDASKRVQIGILLCQDTGKCGSTEPGDDIDFHIEDTVNRLDVAFDRREAKELCHWLQRRLGLPQSESTEPAP